MSFNIFGAIARAVGEVVVQVALAPERVWTEVENTIDRVIEENDE
jgi:hypothetical protein